jgi:hypothetical protein
MSDHSNPPGPPPEPGTPQGPSEVPPRPGVVPLRPLKLGDMLAGAVSYIWRNPLLLGLSALVAVVTQEAPSLITGPMALPDDLTNMGAAVVGILGQFVVAIVLNACLSCLLLVVLSRAVQGEHRTFAGAWQAARPRMLGLIGLQSLIVLAIGGITIVSYALASSLGDMSRGMGVLPVALVHATVVVYLMVRWCLAGVAYVLEPIGVMGAFARSGELVRGEWGRIFGIGFVAIVMVLVPAAILSALTGGYPILIGGYPFLRAELSIGADPTGGSTVVAAIVSIVVSTVAIPFLNGVFGLLYTDQRFRRENFHLQLAQQPGPPPG